MNILVTIRTDDGTGDRAANRARAETMRKWVNEEFGVNAGTFVRKDELVVEFTMDHTADDETVGQLVFTVAAAGAHIGFRKE